MHKPRIVASTGSVDVMLRLEKDLVRKGYRLAIHDDAALGPKEYRRRQLPYENYPSQPLIVLSWHEDGKTV